MAKVNLFLGWLTLLGLSLCCAYRTNELRDAGRQQVAVVNKVSGQVFQRPEILSVFELVLVKDQLFNGDYITTGAGASTEIVLLSSKILVIGENSLVQLSFDSSDEGSDIVTLLKGDVIAKGADVVGKKLGFNVGKNSVQNIGSDSGVRITKRVDQIEATIEVVSGTAQVIGENQVVQDLKLNQKIKVVAEAPVASTQAVVKSMNLAALSVPIIPSSIGKIMADEAVESLGPAPVKKPVTVKPVKVTPEPTVVKKPEPVKVQKVVVKKPKPPVKVKAAPKVAAVAPNAPAIIKPADPYKVVFFTGAPSAFVGNGLYVVKDHRLFAKVTGNPTSGHLLSIMKKYNADLLFRGNAASLLGGVESKAFGTRKVVFAANKDGIQKIDATLVRSRPVALDLLKKGGYSIFAEPVNLMNVGH